ncbi:hypothetical protein OG921_26280 [Aldersonia sp. NBC_00410]|uniref:hypothetical protein n=1 Tax=Aldersonia sp. NBC_00410 TaxID=2975954 RepID=UPI0022597495|nr:hypothetical protein [Aldersonia sp. NBC_00410]MCX5046687.1 hypothetical protein [Aldersonia sp. NBC_00410]
MAVLSDTPGVLRGESTWHGAVAVSSGGWISTLLPGRVLSPGGAVVAMTIAEIVAAQGQALWGSPPLPGMWALLTEWARRLDLNVLDAVIRAEQRPDLGGGWVCLPY